MRINGMGYVCKKCKRGLMSDDVTYYGAQGTSILTNCCMARPVQPGWIDKLWNKLCGK